VHSFRSVIARALAALVIAGALAGDAAASTFNVSPTQVFLDGRTPSALLTLRNDSNEPLRFQLSVFGWDQSPTGEMTLTPTDDIVFFPALVTLAPKEERKIRVGRVVGAGELERSYRIFVEELPPLDSVTSGNAGVKVLTKMGIPIFVRPARESTALAIKDIAGHNGTLTFALANSGTVHVVPEKVTVRGFADGAPVFEKQLSAWYLLAGGRRDFDMPLSAADCARATSYQVEVAFAESKVDQRMAAPAGVCAQ
jgi:fimbrial chaperone protein